MNQQETRTTCNDCGADEGTLLKEFSPERDYFWSELAEMTPVCASCGSENLKEKTQ
jgi:hypothetical protein